MEKAKFGGVRVRANKAAEWHGRDPAYAWVAEVSKGGRSNLRLRLPGSRNFGEHLIACHEGNAEAQIGIPE